MTTPNLGFGNQVAHYQRQQINTLSPSQLIEKLYNIGISGCNQKDIPRVSGVLTELKSSLDFTYKEIALGLYKLYEYCLRRVKAGHYKEVSDIFAQLLETWRVATKDLGS